MYQISKLSTVHGQILRHLKNVWQPYRQTHRHRSPPILWASFHEAKKGIEYDPLIDWYWSVIIISFIYLLISMNKIAFCRNIELSYEVNDTRLSPFRYQSMPIEAITPIWYMVVAMVGQIVQVTYWWSCVAYSGLLKVVKSMTGSFFSLLGRFNRSSKSARAWVWSSTSWVQSCRSYQWSYQWSWETY